MHFIKITEGNYMMGAPDSDSEALEQEKPQKWTHINEFFLSDYLVTIDDFEKFILDTKYEPVQSALYFDGEDWQMDENMRWNDPGYSYMANTPVTCINFLDIQNYIEWISKKDRQRYRLPTEAEWEYAARAGTTESRFWGSSIEGWKDYANINSIESELKSSFKYASPVGYFLPNPWGLYDMLGNVFELTGSDFSDVFNGSELICSHSEELKSYRGGSFNSDTSLIRCTARSGFPVELASNQIGFRLAYE